MMAQVLMVKKTLFIGSQGAWREDYEGGAGFNHIGAKQKLFILAKARGFVK